MMIFAEFKKIKSEKYNFADTRDEDDSFASRIHCLAYAVMYDRAIEQGKHLLGDVLCGWEKARSQTRCGKDADLDAVPCFSCIVHIR